MSKYILPVDVKIVDVATVFSSDLCFRCGGVTTVDDDDDDIIVCTLCETMQFIKDAKRTIAAKLTVITPRSELLDIWISDDTLFDILESDSGPFTREGLLESRPFSMYCNNGQVEYIVHY